MAATDDFDDIEIETFAEFSKNYKKRKKKKFGGFPLPEKRVIALFLLILIALCAVSAVVGYQVGYRSIYGDAYALGYEEGNDLGYNEGLDIGKKDGYDIGYEEGVDAAKNDLYYGVYGGDAVAADVPAGGADIVYCTASGTVYHREGCSYISGKSNLKTMTEADAIASGYGSCSRCGK